MSSGLYHSRIPSTPPQSGANTPRALRQRFAFLDSPRWQLTPGRAILVGIVLAALGLRLWSLDAGLPHAVDPDESSMVHRVLRILNTGDWNPGVFDYPTFVLYLQAAVVLMRFMAGASGAEWASLADFDVAAAYAAGRAVTAIIGAATVWLAYRLGREVASERVGLFAAALLAVLPLHVRESHFMTPDVPLAALTTLAVWLAVRGEQLRPWWAGLAAGLAAAARYSGALALAAVLMGLLIRRDPLQSRLRACGIALATALLAFLITTPYAVLDLPAFLNTFAAHAAVLARSRQQTAGIWLAYAGEFADAGRLWLPFAGAGLLMVLYGFTRRAGRVRWTPILTLITLFAWMLLTHGPASARDALPIVPMFCLLAAVGLDGLCRAIGSVPAIRAPALRNAVPFAVALVLLVPFVQGVVTWQRHFVRRDTRQVATDWIKASLPRGTRIAVERGGPTHLQQAGFDERDVDRLVDHPFDWYEQQRIEYLVVSSASAWSSGYADLGVKVVDIPTLPQRPGPGIRVIRLGTKF